MDRPVTWKMAWISTVVYAIIMSWNPRRWRRVRRTRFPCRHHHVAVARPCCTPRSLPRHRLDCVPLRGRRRSGPLCRQGRRCPSVLFERTSSSICSPIDTNLFPNPPLAVGAAGGRRACMRGPHRPGVPEGNLHIDTTPPPSIPKPATARLG
jgi:hypothetical protein